MASAPVNPETGLNSRQEMFCRELIAHNFNQQKAYLAVYDTTDAKHASASACRLMKKPEIQNYITWLQKERVKELGITAERILAELAEMAFAEKDDEIWGPTTKLKALDLLQKQMGLQQQKIKADVDTNQEIRVTIEDD